MTIEITAAGRQLAADLANAEGFSNLFNPHNIASYPAGKALARLATRFLAMETDMAEIDRLSTLKSGESISIMAVFGVAQSIAARWRVAADPLVEALEAAADSSEHMDMPVLATKLRAELSKRGIELRNCR